MTDGGVPAVSGDERRLATSDGSLMQQPTKKMTEIIQRINPRLKRLNARGGSLSPMPAYATAYDDERRPTARRRCMAWPTRPTATCRRFWR